MENNALKGYKGRAKEVLQSLGGRVWASVVLKTDQGDFEGVILPRSETADGDHVVLKLKSGYNIGIRADRITDIKETSYKEAIYKIPEKEFPVSENKPAVTLLGYRRHYCIAARLSDRRGNTRLHAGGIIRRRA